MTFSVSRPIPEKSIWEFPLMSVGRPAMSGLNRSTRRSSRGSTLYLRASSRNSACSSASFSGFSAARSRAWLQSVVVSYSSHVSSSNAGSEAFTTHGVECLVTAAQPSW